MLRSRRTRSLEKLDKFKDFEVSFIKKKKKSKVIIPDHVLIDPEHVEKMKEHVEKMKDVDGTKSKASSAVPKDELTGAMASSFSHKDESADEGDEIRLGLEELRRERERISLAIERKRLDKVRQELADLNEEEVRKEQSKTVKVAKTVEKELSLDSLMEKIRTLEAASSASSGTDTDSEGDYKKKKKSKGSKRRSKSGLYKKASDRVSKPQDWPHLFLKREYASRDLRFAEMTMPMFVAGEIEIITACKNPLEKEERLNFWGTLMYHAIQTDFVVIKEWYAAVVREIEVDSKKWGDDYIKVGEDIIRRESLHGGKSKEKTVGFSAGFSDQHAVWFCSAFQRNRCSSAAPHKAKVGGVERQVQHICATCYIRTKKQADHPECASTCPFQGE